MIEAALLAGLLSDGLAPAAPLRMPPCSVVGKKIAEASSPPEKGRAAVGPPIRLTVVNATPPPVRPPTFPLVPPPVISSWQCADRTGQLWFHADKQKLESWVGKRNELLRNVEAARTRQAQPFLNTGIPYGYCAGACPPGRS